MNVSISRDGTELGEWSEDQVRALYKEGQLLPSDHYWKEGMTEWAELSKMIKPAPPSSTEAVLKQPRKEKLKPQSFLGVMISLVCMVAISNAIKLLFPVITGYAVYGGCIGAALGLVPYFVARSRDNTKNYNHYLWIATGIGIVAGLIASPTLDSLSYNHTLVEDSDSINKGLPTTIVGMGQLSSTSVSSNGSFHYNFTIGAASEGLNINRLNIFARQQAIDMYSKSPDFKAHGVNLEFDFYNNKGVFLSKVTVGPNDLK